jgi:acetyl esterase/lipase
MRQFGGAPVGTKRTEMAAIRKKGMPMTSCFEIHHELRAIAELVAPLASQPLTIDSLAQERAMMARMLPPPLESPVWREASISGLKDQPPVRIYVINEKSGQGLRPAILHMHGGGFVAGDSLSSVGLMQKLADSIDCVVISVDYRLAPETAFPGALNDNLAALLWLRDNAALIGVDAVRIAVMGESAGGGHAAMLAICARDRGDIPLAAQILIYPMLDDRTGSSIARPEQQGTLIWTRQRNRFGWEALLGQPAGLDRVPHGAVPARVANLAGLPPTFIGVGSLDLFVGEDIEFAHRLIDAGVACELLVVPGAFHAFELMGPTRLGERFQQAIIAAVKAAFAV